MNLDKDLVAAMATPLVLAILADGRSYGYAILKRVHELSHGEIAWTDGMLYPLLHRLERLGHVQASWGESPEGRRRARRAPQAVGHGDPHPRRPVGRDDPGGGLMSDVDARIAQWRAALARSAAVTDQDADELEEHLRDRMADLERSGLDADEAFLIAVKRLGATDAVTAEFAREHGDRLWKQLVPRSRASRWSSSRLSRP